MNLIQTLRYLMLTKLSNFGVAYRNRFPESSHAREQFETVDAAVRQLGTYAVSKMSAGHAGKSSKALAREALFGRLEDFGRTARAISQNTPGLEDKFHLPDPQTDLALITAGRLFAQDAGPFTAQFVGHAMPATFIADLIALVDQFEQAIRERETGKDDRTAARTSIEQALESATNAAREARRHRRQSPEGRSGDGVGVEARSAGRPSAPLAQARRGKAGSAPFPRPETMAPATAPSSAPVEAATSADDTKTGRIVAL